MPLTSQRGWSVRVAAATWRAPTGHTTGSKAYANFLTSNPIPSGHVLDAHGHHLGHEGIPTTRMWWASADGRLPHRGKAARVWAHILEKRVGQPPQIHRRICKGATSLSMRKRLRRVCRLRSRRFRLPLLPGWMLMMQTPRHLARDRVPRVPVQHHRHAAQIANRGSPAHSHVFEMLARARRSPTGRNST